MPSHRLSPLPSLQLLCWIGIGVIATVVGAATACLWDYDTLKAEAAGLPGVVDIIVGRFDRYPPLYYQMRLDRITPDLAAGATDLDLYDNAGVACDKLGRYDDAIEWMARKLEVIEKLESGTLQSTGQDLADHRYRYLANLGTFHIHRWLATGADRTEMADAELARDLIADAIELNPDAHFGREIFQLRAIHWIIERPDEEQFSWFGASFLDLEEANGHKLPDLAPRREPSNRAVKGITGIIALGAGWESVDLFNALSTALNRREDAVLASLARLRMEELLQQGKQSLWSIRPDADLHIGSSLAGTTGERLKAYYPKARAEAEGWRWARTQYMLARLTKGEHPDTHPNFWREWSSPTSPPELPGHGPIVWGFITLGGGLLALILRRRLRKIGGWIARVTNRRGAGDPFAA